jgi:DNA mismatch repair protein MutS2
MNPHTLRVLEFDAIRERVVGHASCSLGQERAAGMAPSTRVEEVGRLQAETTEAVRLLDLPGNIPFGGIHDIRPAVRAAAVEGMLEPHALLAVADTAAGARKLKAYLVQRHETAPRLADYGRRIGEFPVVESSIADAIDENAEVRDDASPALARTRKEMRTVRARMTERLHSYLRNPAYRDMIQDPVVTVRDGRYCIPVKSEHRSQFGGLVHDQSSSGATVFMEPAAVVELGNELRSLEAKERHEVERVLRELTSKVGRHAEDLTWTVETLADLDYIFARGRLSYAMNASEPIIDLHGFIGLRRARHPLLTGNVVPIDVELGRKDRVLVITGPNTGGKTVTLKTTGLLALMAQCGLHVPADSGSTLPVFEGVFADIGDEQSIQQSLSTFSGHITNIARILGEVEKAGPRSLVLLDEVGAGTDPMEGAALAKSILHTLLETGARTIATTHYGELKEFAYSTEGVENASVEFDLETLRPTYRLLIGIPGSSNAFTIAARLGLPEEVVHGARGMIGTDRAVLSDVIERLTEDQRATEQGLRRAARSAKEVERKELEYERKLRQLEADRIDILNRARNEADQTLRTARKEIERLKEELKRVEKELRKRSTEPGDPAALQKVRDRLQRASGRIEGGRTARAAEKIERLTAPPPDPEVQTDRQPPAVGDLVWVGGLNQRGTLLTPAAEGKAQVQIGAMRMTLPWESLQRIVTPRTAGVVSAPSSRKAGSPDMAMLARAHISPEVNLRGMRVEEALTQLEEYVDDACLAGLSPFRIVHGKGTGALKKVVWEYLQNHPNISTYRHPAEEEGGSGVTIVELRE